MSPRSHFRNERSL